MAASIPRARRAANIRALRLLRGSRLASAAHIPWPEHRRGPRDALLPHHPADAPDAAAPTQLLPPQTCSPRWRGRRAEEKFFNVLISSHLGFEDLFVFNCRNKRIVRTSVLLAFAAQIRAAASPAEPRADERENRGAFELLAADGSQVAACVCWGGGIYSLVRFICSPCFPFFSLSQRFSWMLFPRRLCSSDKAPRAPRSSCLCVTPEQPSTGYLEQPSTGDPELGASQSLQQQLRGRWHRQHRGRRAGSTCRVSRNNAADRAAAQGFLVAQTGSAFWEW